MDPRIQLQGLNINKDKACCFDLRILVDGQFIKYVTIDFIYLLKHLQLDLDNRNQKHIALNLRNYCRLPVVNVENPQLPEVKNPWHGVKVDYLELELEESLSFYADKVKSSLFKASVIAKFAPCPNKMKAIVDETAAYKWIKEEDIGPKFLGHITEVNNENQEGRVIGFLLELIPDARHATLDDLPQCQETLKKLHKLGIKHGNIKGENFLIKDKKAILIDFKRAEKCQDEKELEKEFQNLQRQLELEKQGMKNAGTQHEAMQHEYIIFPIRPHCN